MSPTMISSRHRTMIYLSLVMLFGASLALTNDSTGLEGCDWLGDGEGGCKFTHGPKKAWGFHPLHDICYFDDHAYPAIGMLRVPESNIFDPRNRQPVWTQLESQKREFANQYQIAADILLSWNKDVNTSQPDVETCAIMFVQKHHKLSFAGSDDNLGAATGTCSDAIDQDCMDEVIDFFTGTAKNATGHRNICAALPNEVFYDLTEKSKKFPSCMKGRNKYFEMAYVEKRTITYDGDRVLSDEELDAGGGCFPSFHDRADAGIERVFRIPDLDWSSHADVLANSSYAITPMMLLTAQERPDGGRDVAASLDCLKVVDPDLSMNASRHHGSWMGAGTPGPRAALPAALSTLALGIAITVGGVLF